MPMITAAQAIPLLISALAFAVVILFFFGVLQAYRRLRYKRELVKKVHASAEAWESPEKLDILLAKEPKEGKRLLYLLSSCYNLVKTCFTSMVYRYKFADRC